MFSRLVLWLSLLFYNEQYFFYNHWGNETILLITKSYLKVQSVSMGKKWKLEYSQVWVEEYSEQDKWINKMMISKELTVRHNSVCVWMFGNFYTIVTCLFTRIRLIRYDYKWYIWEIKWWNKIYNYNNSF